MQLKKTLFVSSLLLLASACTDKDNNVRVEMTDCEGTECSFDASKSKIKSHSHVLEYDWEFHDDTDMEVTKDPKVKHDFNIHVGATLDGNDPDLDLREVTLDEVLTNHHIVSKTFKFRTHQHDPKALFLAKKSELLGLDGTQLFDLDASESEAGQGNIKEYIWEIDGKKYITDSPEFKHEFKSGSKGDIKLIVVNSFGVENSILKNINSLEIEPKLLDLNIERNDDGTYSFSVNSEEYSSDKYTLGWKLNGEHLNAYDNIKEIKNIVANKGENSIEAYLTDKLSSDRTVSSRLETFNTNDEAPAQIIYFDADEVKYSDGLHYNLVTDFKNLRPKEHKVLYYLNNSLLDGAGNIEVLPGLNKAIVKVIDRDTRKVLDERNVEFNAKKDSLKIAHIFALEGSDKYLYNFSSLEYGFDENSQEKEWGLNGNVINNVNDVPVKKGVNKIVLNIKDKNSGEVLSTKTKEWDTENAVSISSIHPKPLEGADPFHYKFTADYNHYDETKHTIKWTYQDGTEITDPNKVKLENGLNKIYLYVLDKDTGEVLAAANSKVTLKVPVPEVDHIEAHVQTDLAQQGLEYHFTGSYIVRANNDSNWFSERWVLNGKEIDPSKALAREGQNTIDLYIVNNYTGDTIDYDSLNFTAKKEVSKLEISMSGNPDERNVLVRDIHLNKSGGTIYIDAINNDWGGYECMYNYDGKSQWAINKTYKITNFDNTKPFNLNCQYSGKVDSSISLNANFDGETATSQKYKFANYEKPNITVSMSGDKDQKGVLTRDINISHSGNILYINPINTNWDGYECMVNYDGKIYKAGFNSGETIISPFDNSKKLTYNCKYSGNVDSYIGINIGMDNIEAKSETYRFSR